MQNYLPQLLHELRQEFLINPFKFNPLTPVHSKIDQSMSQYSVAQSAQVHPVHLAAL